MMLGTQILFSGLMDPAATSALSGLKTNDVTSSQLTTRKTLLPSLFKRKPKELCCQW
jgi:hypothetical protein